MTNGQTLALTEFVARGQLGEGVFRAMVEALPVAIYITDANGRLTFFNEAAVKLSGRVPEIGTDEWCVTWKLFLPDGTPLPHDQCPMAQALKGGDVPTGIECMAERPDGTRFWFTPCPAILRDAAGSIVGGINMLVDITDRKNAELEASEHFRAVVEATPECMTIIAQDGTLLFLNPPCVATVGAPSAEALIGTSFFDLIASEDRNRYRDFHQKICQGEKGALEFDIVGMNGVRRHMETHAVPLRHTDGKIVHVAITRDITERQKADRAALLLGAIVDSSDDAIISKDLEGVITSWNQGAQRLFGYTAEETIGKSVSLLIPPDRQSEEPGILERLKRGERVDHFETLRRTREGKLLDISLTISPVKDAQGNIIGASKIARDITERKLIEEAFRESQARFRQLADSMPHMVWTARPDGFIDYYNERWYEFTGFSRTALGDASWEPALHSQDLPRWQETWYDAVQSGEPYIVEHRFWDRQEHRWRWFMGRALPVRDAAGKIVKWYGSCTDIDDQKRIEKDLRRANEDLEQFAYSASHDLQEPVRTVKIYGELLMKKFEGETDVEAREFLEYLRMGATRMDMLVRDLLTYTQVTKFEAPAEAADASDALNSTLAGMAGLIAETGARITADPLPSLRVHPVHLQQLFQNLVSNAIKYASPDRPPAVHVSAQDQNGYWAFAVADNGIGIDPAYQENIFGLFKRLHSNTEYSGTGIGLAICRRIVDRYHGRIWVESELGKGSTFRFTLPA